jgi:hypothetical protein
MPTEKTMRRQWRYACVFLIALVAVAPPAGAAVFNVASGDVAGLIAAIDSANATAEPDTINLAAGTYTLTTPQATGRGGDHERHPDRRRRRERDDPDAEFRQSDLWPGQGHGDGAAPHRGAHPL